MLKTTLTALTTSGAIAAAVLIFSADAEAGGKRRPSTLSAGPVKMKTVDRRSAARLRSKTGPGASAQGTQSRADWMAGVCNSAGGGASSNPDGTVSCVDPDGNNVLDPAPAPD